MKIAVVTMKVKQGKCEENFAFMEKQIAQAIKDGADLIVFPQNAISGYLLGDRWLEDAWCRYVDSFNEKLIALSEHIAIVWGNIKYRNHRRFNAAFFAYDKTTHMRVKKNIKNGFGNDGRYYEENSINSAIEYKDMVFALNFGKEVQLADMNINIDACPYDMDEDTSVMGNVIYANACGTQNSGKTVMIMQGGSSVRYQKNLLYQAPFFEEAYALVNLETSQTKTYQTPQLLDALTFGIREFDKEVFGGKVPWIIGLSGGLDSSVNCALLAYALGSERVYAFNMATKHNSDLTINNALEEAKALGVHYKEGSIEGFVDASHHTFVDTFGFDSEYNSTLVMENIQARTRGYLLGGFASILGGVIANNGNKVESMLGYCTLYGDSVGALALIGDLNKVQLFALSKEINKRYRKEIIPESLLPNVKNDMIEWEMAPSAELKEHQFDPMKWFYHDYLVEHLGRDLDVITFMQKYLNKQLDEEVVKWLNYYHLDEPEAFLNDLDWFLETMDKNSFKRLQMPPVLCLHKKTLAMQVDAQMCYDKTMYQTLRKEILNR